MEKLICRGVYELRSDLGAMGSVIHAALRDYGRQFIIACYDRKRCLQH